MTSISAEELSKEYGFKIVGKTTEPIHTYGSLKKHAPNSLLWLKSEKYLPKIKCGYLIVSADINLPQTDDITFLVTDKKPRLVFSKIANRYFVSHEHILENCVEEHRKNKKIIISDHVFIGKNVEIGDGTVIYPNVVIEHGTIIGKNCVIKSHVSLNTEGLGLEMDPETNEYVKFPQLGNVVLEDNIEIGPCSTVRRAAMDSTIIGKGTRIGSLVNIGHNCIIGKNCILTSQIVTSGSSEIGDNVFIGVGSSVKNGVNIGSDVTVGHGAVVTKDLAANKVYVGNPVVEINEYKAWSEVKKKLMDEYNGAV